jgi:hypothetical protein
MSPVQSDNFEHEGAILRIVPTSETDDVPAWELIDVGRYQPRRIRGSYRGRELG